jgi:type I restriction enzyme R subunit
MFNDLLELARDITQEDKRAMKENLTEEELSIFDLLYKSDLTPEEEKQVKKASHELLEKIKDKLVLDWKKYEPKRADVEVSIEDYLFYNLPRSYD